MNGQPQLWVPAVEALHVQCLYRPLSGWEAFINWRRSGHTWDAEPTRLYDSLVTGELLDVLCAELTEILGG